MLRSHFVLSTITKKEKKNPILSSDRKTLEDFPHIYFKSLTYWLTLVGGKRGEGKGVQ